MTEKELVELRYSFRRLRGNGSCIIVGYYCEILGGTLTIATVHSTSMIMAVGRARKLAIVDYVTRRLE